MLRLTVHHRRGDHEVRAVATPVPGLVVNEDAETPGEWMVTHESSGYGVAVTPDPETALAAAVELGALADWTRSGRDLREDPAVNAAWTAWAAERFPETFGRPPGNGRGL